MKIIYSDKHQLHCPQKYLGSGRIQDYPDVIGRMNSVLQALTNTPHTIHSPIDHGLIPILRIHSQEYIQFIKTAYQEWVENGGDPNGVIPDTFASKLHSRYQPKLSNIFVKAGIYVFDTAAVITQNTYEASYEAVQVSLTAADTVLNGKRVAFALTRPPGHHSLSNQAGGFCFFNNAAVTAQYLIDTSHRNVCVLDVDYHHGNGTQCCFYESKNPLFVSIHGKDDYPFFWGSSEEKGDGDGLGYNLNYALPKGTNDTEYLNTLDQAIQEILKFKTEYLVVSLGVDTFYGDPVGTFDLSHSCFFEIGKRIEAIGLPTVLVMEGGYNVEEMGNCVVNFLRAFGKEMEDTVS